MNKYNYIKTTTNIFDYASILQVFLKISSIKRIHILIGNFGIRCLIYSIDMLLQKDPELTSNYRVTDIYFQITCIAEPGLSNNKKEATSDYTV